MTVTWNYLASFAPFAIPTGTTTPPTDGISSFTLSFGTETFIFTLGGTAPAGQISGFDYNDGAVHALSVTGLSIDATAFLAQNDHDRIFGLFDFPATHNGSPGSDVMFGGAGADTMFGNAGSDSIAGNDGNDTIDGGPGQDVISGGAGNDMLKGGPGAELDIFDGGPGFDTVDYSGRPAITVTLNGANFALVKVGGGVEDSIVNVEAIIGGAGNDVLTGDGLGNLLSGGGGADRITGRGGSDRLSGGAGGDTFVFSAIVDSKVGPLHDIITDFNHSQHDKLDLHLIDADQRPGHGGNQAFVFIGADSFAHYHALHPVVFGMVRYAGGLVQANVNANLAADFEIKVVGASHASDFVL